MRSILLDADCIIELFEIGKWKEFLQANSIFIPSIVSDEAQHYNDAGGWRHFIDFSEDQKNNNFNILEANAIELIDTGNLLHSVDIHKGELEAIALLRRSEQSNVFFCTGDHQAIIACCLLKMEDQCISLEKALNTCGLTSRTKKHYTESVMKQRKKEGIQIRTTHTDWSQE